MPSIKTWTSWCTNTGFHENDQRAAVPLLQRQAERPGLVQPGEGLAAPCWYLKGAYKQDGDELFTWSDSDRSRGYSFKLKEEEIQVRCQEGVPYSESGEALDWAAQRGCGCLRP